MVSKQTSDYLDYTKLNKKQLIKEIKIRDKAILMFIDNPILTGGVIYCLKEFVQLRKENKTWNGVGINEKVCM